MKKNGFTLIELIAVLVILSIIALLAAPNIIILMQGSKEKAFVSEVQDFVSTATYMYKIENKRNKSFSGANLDMIYIKNLEGTVPVEDPYGYTYKADDSYIKFVEPEEGNESLGTRTVIVYIKSCLTKSGVEECHYLCSNNGTKLVTDDIKGEGECSIS